MSLTGGGTLNTKTYITLTVRDLIYAAREIVLFLAHVGSKALSILHTHAATPETSLLALLSGSKKMKVTITKLSPNTRRRLQYIIKVKYKNTCV